MGRLKKTPTKLMRVPKSFDFQIDKMTKSYGYKSKTEFLDKQGKTIFENVDYINKVFNPFRRKTNK